jgi:hypothetical protein
MSPKRAPPSATGAAVSLNHTLLLASTASPPGWRRPPCRTVAVVAPGATW